MTTPETPKRGFAAMDPERRREIARKGGVSVPSEKRSFSKDRILAAAAGAKGGASAAWPKGDASVFVFGSNLAGRHGKGAALWAKRHRGAIQGQGVGLQGDSWAIPTKDRQLRPLPLSEIAGYVAAFLAQAEVLYPDRTFEVTPIGCGLAGYTPDQIGPMFRDAPPNVRLPGEFLAVLRRSVGDA
jgi:general stress protein YciG